MQATIQDRGALRKAILKSQHCQRNFDLKRSFPEEDLELLKTACQQAPSKQNAAFYKAHFVFERKRIEEICRATKGFIFKTKMGGVDYQTNSQTLANLVIVFEEIEPFKDPQDKLYRNGEIEAIARGQATMRQRLTLKKDALLAVGVAAGYVNLAAGLMGYGTGCCSCFHERDIKKALGLSRKPLLIMGVGFKDTQRNRREHHQDQTFIFPSKKKQPIEVSVHGIAAAAKTAV